MPTETVVPAQAVDHLEPQRAGRILKAALIEIRHLARKGSSEQAAALADAVHNIPALLIGGQVDKRRLRADLAQYHSASSARGVFDYTELLDKDVDF